MTLNDLNTVNTQYSLGYNISVFDPVKQIISINDKVCIPVALTDPYLSAPIQITVKNNDAVVIGELCIGEGIGFDTIYPLSDFFNIAYLIDVEKGSYRIASLKRNYLVIDSCFYDEYMRMYYDTAHFSGVYSHQELNSRSHVVHHEVILKNGYTKKNSMQVENSIRSILLPFAFEKYLKYYHNLELRFDQIVFEKIRNLNPDMNGFAEIMNSYKRDDIERLVYLFDNVSIDYSFFIPILNKTLNYQQSFDILIKFGKERNPLVTEKQNRYLEIKTKGNFSITTLKAVGIQDCDVFLKKTIIYCIYRFRCCIAHNKIGEYVMTLSDEQYVDEVCIPLIQEACFQIMK